MASLVGWLISDGNGRILGHGIGAVLYVFGSCERRSEPTAQVYIPLRLIPTERDSLLSLDDDDNDDDDDDDDDDSNNNSSSSSSNSSSSSSSSSNNNNNNNNNNTNNNIIIIIIIIIII